MKPPILLVGTANRHKLVEIEALLADLPVRVLGIRHLPRQIQVSETGSTFEENAREKAICFARTSSELPEEIRPIWVISDDSGLCVDALQGDPGVRSARYAGPAQSYKLNNQKLIKELENVPASQRSALFICVIACASVPREEAGPEILFEARGECRGQITEGLRGSGGFGYDPLFLVPELGKTFAELTEEEKNKISHRGKALRRFRELLRPLLDLNRKWQL